MSRSNYAASAERLFQDRWLTPLALLFSLTYRVDVYDVVVDVGASEIRNRVYVSIANPDLTITLPSAENNRGASSTVDVSELMVPRKAKKCFDKASKLLQKNHVDDALKELNEALSMWPRYPAALSLRGFIEMAGNRHDQALNDFNAALANDPGYAPAYVGLAADYNRTGKFDQALRVLDRSKPFTSGSWQLHFEASKALLGMKSFTNALKEANEASKLYGQERPDFRLVRAQAYLQLNQTESAIQELRECLAIESKGPRAEKIRQFLSTLRK